MNNTAGNTMNYASNTLSPTAPWAAEAPAARPQSAAESVPLDWTDLERLEQVVARQRRYMVRDVAAAVAFAGLCLALVFALL